MSAGSSCAKSVTPPARTATRRPSRWRAARIVAARAAWRDGRSGRGGSGRPQLGEGRRGGPRGTRPRATAGRGDVAGRAGGGRPGRGCEGEGARGVGGAPRRGAPEAATTVPRRAARSHAVTDPRPRRTAPTASARWTERRTCGESTRAPRTVHGGQQIAQAYAHPPRIAPARSVARPGSCEAPASGTHRANTTRKGARRSAESGGAHPPGAPMKTSHTCATAGLGAPPQASPSGRLRPHAAGHNVVSGVTLYEDTTTSSATVGASTMLRMTSALAAPAVVDLDASTGA